MALPTFARHGHSPRGSLSKADARQSSTQSRLENQPRFSRQRAWSAPDRCQNGIRGTYKKSNQGTSHAPSPDKHLVVVAQNG